MSGLPQAVLVTTGFTLLAMILPPLGLLAGGSIALITLRLGIRQGITVAAASSLVVGLLLLITGQSAAVALLFALLQWLPLVLLSAYLASTANWTQTLQAGLLITLSGILMAYLFVPDLQGTWREFLDAQLKPVLEQAMSSAGQLADTAQLNEVLDHLSRIITGMLLASVLLATLLMLMLGRAMQAALYNPGGFKTEFNSLHMGLWPGVLGIALTAITLLTEHSLPEELAIVILVVCFLQGMAVIHFLFDHNGWHQGLLFAIYVLLALQFTLMSILISGLGLIDVFANIRSRYSRAKPD